MGRSLSGNVEKKMRPTPASTGNTVLKWSSGLRLPESAIFFRGPVPGSVHDAKIYKAKIPRTEGFLFDRIS